MKKLPVESECEEDRKDQWPPVVDTRGDVDVRPGPAQQPDVETELNVEEAAEISANTEPESSDPILHRTNNHSRLQETQIVSMSTTQELEQLAAPKMVFPSLRRNFSWTLLGNVYFTACRWAFVVILSKLGTLEMVGTFALALAVTSPVIMFSNLQLRPIQAIDVAHRFHFRDYFGLRLLATALACIGVVGFTAFGTSDPTTRLVINLFMIAKAIEAVSDVIYGQMQQHEKMQQISLSLIGRGTASLMLLAAFVRLTGQLSWGVAGIAIGWLAVLLCYDIPRVYRELCEDEGETGGSFACITPSLHYRETAALLVLAVPMGAVMMLSSLSAQMPVYFVEKYLGRDEVAVFAGCIYIVVAQNMLMTSLGQAAAPRMATLFAHGRTSDLLRLITRLSLIGCAIGLMGVVVCWFWGDLVLSLLYSSRFSQYAPILVISMLAAVVQNVSCIFGYALTAVRAFRVQVPLFIGVLAATTLFCFWLVPGNGLMGAAIGTVLTSVVQLLLSMLAFFASIRTRRDSSAQAA